MPGFWQKCEWCDGTKKLWDVINQCFVPCAPCAGLGEKWIEEQQNNDR